MNNKIRNFCKFVSVCDYLLVLEFIIITAIIANAWFFLNLYFGKLLGSEMLVINLVFLLMTVLSAGAGVGVLYAAVILWEPKEETHKIYICLQVFSIVFAVIMLVVGIVANVLDIFNVWLSLFYYIACVGILIMNSVAFGVKRNEQRNVYKSSTSIPDISIDASDETPTVGVRALDGEYAGAVFLLNMNEKITLGTQPQFCQILFQDRHISRTHCIIKYRMDIKAYEIVDYSRNGTYWLNGERLPFGEVCKCRAGTIFVMGGQKEMFQFL